jgi:hypothetical protein
MRAGREPKDFEVSGDQGDSPEGRNPSRPSGQASKPPIYRDSAKTPESLSYARNAWQFRDLSTEITDFHRFHTLFFGPFGRRRIPLLRHGRA